MACFAKLMVSALEVCYAHSQEVVLESNQATSGFQTRGSQLQFCRDTHFVPKGWIEASSLRREGGRWALIRVHVDSRTPSLTVSSLGKNVDDLGWIKNRSWMRVRGIRQG
ncbi:hypothetical protein EDD37DRAFT_138833 [Exophiala viscosa]|uniref:Secreted protein n=1 Tax=Exophiala viscosa TaxID=2486360 RepID=A0AAN6DMC7_9EURO|nr:hypothetical protein EDD36DRAFT_84017 [Exophiala viscosa]KAI1620946.1 hypothetical protein EDD37DRAFT_138833 [Exophiala viscosa]